MSTPSPVCGHPAVIRGCSVWRRWLLEEPFRLFFVLGIVAGIAGALVWPAYYAISGMAYPGIVHARLMFQGFVFAYFIGFLGTAGPRLLEVEHARKGELSIIACGWVFPLLLHGGGWFIAGDAAFLALYLYLLTRVLSRWPHRKDLPPPDFVLVAAGLACGFLGTLLLLLANGGWLPAFWLFPLHALGKLLLYQGLPLLPIMGISGFFFGRFFGQSPKAAQPGTRDPDAAYVRRTTGPALVALILLASFGMEAWGQYRLGNGLRMIIVTACLWGSIPMRMPGPEKKTLGRLARSAILLVILGLALPVMDPGNTVALRHTFFLGGVSLVIMAVSVWVTYAHAGRRREAGLQLRTIEIAAGFVLLALVSRVAADYTPGSQASHYIYAAVSWLLGLVIWGKTLMDRVREAEPDDPVSPE